MPPIMHESDEPTVKAEDTRVVEDEALLFDEDGNLTLETETIGRFISDVDFSDMLDDPDVAEHAEVTAFVGQLVENPETGESEVIPLSEADLEEKGYGKDYMGGKGGKGGMKGKYLKGKKAKMPADAEDDDEDDDEEVEEGEAQTTMPAHGSLSGASKAGMVAAMMGRPTVKIGYNGNSSGGETVGKGDKQHKPGAHALSPDSYSESEEVELDEGGLDLDENGIGVFELWRVPGAVIAEHIDLDDLVEMFPHWLYDLPEATLEDRARKAIFEDLLELDYAAMYPGLDMEAILQAEARLQEQGLDEKSFFKKQDFRKRQFKGAAPTKWGPAGKGTNAMHDQRVRQMVAMIHKGVIVAPKSGKGYREGSRWKYKNKAGTPSGNKQYAIYKDKKIKSIKKGLSQNPGLAKAREKVVSKMVFPNLGLKWNAANWTPPEDRSDLGLGPLYKYIAKGKKKKAAPKKLKAASKKKAPAKAAAKGKKKGGALKASAPQVAANMTEAVEEIPRPPRRFGNSGPRLAGLVESHLHGARAAHQLDEDTK